MKNAAIEDPVLRRFRSELERLYGDRLARVLLYGSRARGDHHGESDYDVAIFIKDMSDWLPESRRVSEVIHSLGAFDHLFSPALFSSDDYDSRTPLMHEIRMSGVEL